MAAKIEVGTVLRNTRHHYTGKVQDSYEVDGTTHYIVEIVSKDGQRVRQSETSSWNEQHVEIVNEDNEVEHTQMELLETNDTTQQGNVGDEVVENTTVEEEVVEETTEETTEDGVYKEDDEVGIAVVITQKRWLSLKVTVEDIAEECGVSVEAVNNVIASETYLDIIHGTFVEHKGWQTWAKKGAKIVAKRLWITEETAQRIIDDILANV